MIEIYGLDHIVLRSSQMEEMLHFYCKVLGCPEVCLQHKATTTWITSACR